MRVDLTNNWQKVNIIKECAIQNTGEKIVRVAVLDADVAPATKDFGFILNRFDTIDIKLGEIVYSRSQSSSSTIEVG